MDLRYALLIGLAVAVLGFIVNVATRYDTVGTFLIVIGLIIALIVLLGSLIRPNRRV